MDNPQNDRIAQRQSQREALTAEIQNEVECVVNEVLDVDAPADWPDEVRDEIRKSALDHTRHILSSLGLDELRSDSARQTHVQNAARETRHQIHLEFVMRLPE